MAECFADLPALGDYYDREGIPIVKLMVMCELMADDDYKCVRQDELSFHGTMMFISTVWIGNDPGFQRLERESGWRPYGPMVFETMVFVDGHAFHSVRYATVRGARSGHLYLLNFFRGLGGKFMLPKSPLMLESGKCSPT